MLDANDTNEGEDSWLRQWRETEEAEHDAWREAWKTNPRALRAQARRAALEQSISAGWKPNKTREEGAAWCALWAFNWFDDLDTVEQVLTYFERVSGQGNKTVNVVPFKAAEPAPDLIKTSAEFVRGFVPPDYLIDGIFQRRFCYSLTAQTGVGKTAVAMLLSALVATGRKLGSIDVEQGSVLYFAGENPTDIQTRWLGLTYAFGLKPENVNVHFVPGARPMSEIAAAITAEVTRKQLQPSLVIVDTAAAYFEGDEENSNTQLGAYARQLRSLTTLPGGPCVIVLCHPTKRAGEDDLIPRGGGAFLAEVDGNIALVRREATLLATPGKWRGSNAWELRFELDKISDHPQLKDTRGRQIPTVIAKPISEAAADMLQKGEARGEDCVLRAVPGRHELGKSASDIARDLKWFIKNDAAQPAHTKVLRLLERLKKEKLVEDTRSRWRLTSKGEMELNRMDMATPTATPGLAPLPPFNS